MVKLVGHTMAVPGIPTTDAIELFARIGLDGIEIVAREGQPFDLTVDDKSLAEILAASKAERLPVVTVTPYMWEINNPDAAVRMAQVSGLKRAVDIAVELGGRFVRAYGGSDKFGTDRVHFDRTVESLQDAGAYAADRNITIVVENHPGTLTPSGKATAEMVRTVGLDSVRALFDPANALHTVGEEPAVCLAEQEGIIGYVHCKDYYFEGDKRRACVVGKGIVPWDSLLPALAAQGASDYISFEYEKLWYPQDLDDAETGLPECIAYVRSALGEYVAR